MYTVSLRVLEWKEYVLEKMIAIENRTWKSLLIVSVFLSLATNLD